MHADIWMYFINLCVSSIILFFGKGNWIESFLLNVSLSGFGVKRHFKCCECFQYTNVKLNIHYFLYASEELQSKMSARSIKNFIKCFTWIEYRVSSVDGYYIKQVPQSSDTKRLFGIIFIGVLLGQIMWSNQRIVMISSAKALSWYIKYVKWFSSILYLIGVLFRFLNHYNSGNNKLNNIRGNEDLWKIYCISLCY